MRAGWGLRKGTRALGRGRCRVGRCLGQGMAAGGGALLPPKRVVVAECVLVLWKTP